MRKELELNRKAGVCWALISSVLSGALLLGCAGAPRTAVVPSTIAFRETSTFDVTQAVLEQGARECDVPVAQLATFGLTQKSYEREELHTLRVSLDNTVERDLLTFLKFVREDASKTGGLDKSFTSEVTSQLQGAFLTIVLSVLTKEELQSLVIDLSELSKVELPSAAPGAELGARAAAPPKKGASDPNPPPPPLPTSALPPRAADNVRRISLTLDRLADGTQRRLALKRRLASWLDTRIAMHEFNPSVTLTLDLASADQKPLVVSEIIYVAMPGIDARAFALKNRDCNQPITACRMLYRYDTSTADLAKLKTVLGEKFKDGPADQTFRRLLRLYLDAIDVSIEAFVDGRSADIEMPGRLMKIE